MRSYAYTKDVIAATAGVFFAGAAFVSVRDLINRAGAVGAGSQYTALLMLVVLAITWSYRAAGSYAGLRAAAYRNRVAWVSPDDWLKEQEIDVVRPEERSLMLRLQGDALFHQPAAVPLVPALRGRLEFDWWQRSRPRRIRRRAPSCSDGSRLLRSSPSRASPAWLQ